MASFFFFSEFGDVLPIALHLKGEGHKVRMATLKPEGKRVGQGYVDRALMPSKGDIVIFDCTGQGTLGAKLRSDGYKVIGGNPYDKDLEENRTKGSALMKKRGIKIPETETFASIPDAIRFLEHQGEDECTWFFKPSGHEFGGTNLTHSSDSPEEMVRFLHWAEDHAEGIKSFEMQKGVTGLEVSTNGWFDGERFVYPFDSTLEDKKLMTGDLGPRTGCAANIVWMWEEHDALLPKLTVERITQDLKRERYVGPIDLNAIIDDDRDEIYGLEWTARLGFDATPAWMLLLSDTLYDVGEQLELYARGELKEWYWKRGKMALTLRVSVPPYPVSTVDVKESVGMPLDKRLVEREHFLPYYVMKGKDGLPALAGVDGNVGCVSVIGTDIEQMRREVLKHAHDYDIPSAQYRTDPVLRAEKAWARLQDLGYIAKPKRPAA